MPMLDIQRRHAEVFRLRFGEKGSNGAPKKLTDAIRVTAASKSVIDAFVEVYGGETQPWENQYQAYLPITEIPIMVLPGQSITQWWEKYAGSTCQRRCDGITETQTGQPCMCADDITIRVKDRNQCSPMTRVNVLCPEVAVIGAGSIVTHGLIAAETLPQSIRVAEAALSRGLPVPAVLRVIEHKSRNHYVIPQIEVVGLSFNQLTELPASDSAALTTPRAEISVGGNGSDQAQAITEATEQPVPTDSTLEAELDDPNYVAPVVKRTKAVEALIKSIKTEAQTKGITDDVLNSLVEEHTSVRNVDEITERNDGMAVLKAVGEWS